MRTVWVGRPSGRGLMRLEQAACTGTLFDVPYVRCRYAQGKRRVALGGTPPSGCRSLARKIA